MGAARHRREPVNSLGGWRAPVFLGESAGEARQCVPNPCAAGLPQDAKRPVERPWRRFARGRTFLEENAGFSG